MYTGIDTIYLIHHSHTDIGYTHDQPIVSDLHRRFTDTALDQCERDADSDSDHVPLDGRDDRDAPALDRVSTRAPGRPVR